MMPYNLLLISGGGIWFIVFLMIVGREIVDPKHRRVVTRLPLWKILLIGILWPFICVGIPLWLSFKFGWHKLNDNDPFNQGGK